MSQTPETNDIALVHLKSPMEMTDFVQVRGKFFCHCHFCRHHYCCYAAFALIVENTQRISLPLCDQVIPLTREEVLEGDCITAGWGTHSLGSLIPGRSVVIILDMNNFIARHQRSKDIKATVKKRQYRQKPSSGCYKSRRPPSSTAPTAWTSSLHV